MIITERWEKCNDCKFDQPVNPGEQRHGGHRNGKRHTIDVHWVDVPQ